MSKQLFQANINRKPGVFQPVTGQAIVVATTCVDDQHASNMIQRIRNKKPDTYPFSGNDKEIVSRVESHCIGGFFYFYIFFVSWVNINLFL